MVNEEMHFKEKTLFDLDPKIKVTQNVAQLRPHHAIYAPAKFAVATSNDLGGDAFTRNLSDGCAHAHTGRRMRCDLDKINASVILLLNNHLNISVNGQDASRDRTFLHSKNPKSFLLQTLLLYHM